MKKRIVLSHGDKGGSGKSTISARLIEAAIKRGIYLYLVEGDTGVPDVAHRYRTHVEGIQIPLQRSDAADAAMVALFNELEQITNEEHGPDTIIINLPAGASGTVDSRAEEIIAPVAEALGMEIVTLYAISPGRETVQSVEASVKNGLCGISHVKIAVINDYLGDGDRYDWAQSSVREQWLADGGLEFRLPVLMPEIRDKCRNLGGTLFQLVSGEAPGLTLVERSVVSRWLRQTQPIAETALGLCDTEEDPA